MHFDRLFGFLTFLSFTMMMVAMATETCWWWTECDKQYVMNRMWWTVYDEQYVMNRMWWTECDEQYVMNRMWWTECDEQNGMNRMWWTVCDEQYVMNRMWWTHFTYVHLLVLLSELKYPFNALIWNTLCCYHVSVHDILLWMNGSIALRKPFSNSLTENRSTDALKHLTVCSINKKDQFLLTYKS